MFSCYSSFAFNQTKRWRLLGICSRITTCYLWPHIVMGRHLYFAALVSIFLLSSFFLACSQRSDIGCLLYFHTWCGISANLKCRSEMCCTRLAEHTGRKNYEKNRHLGTIAQLCRAIYISSQLHVSTIGKKLVKRQNFVNMSLTIS